MSLSPNLSIILSGGFLRNTTCPTCEETIYFDESVLEDGEVICPNCGEKLEFDLNGLEDEDKPQDEE